MLPPGPELASRCWLTALVAARELSDFMRPLYCAPLLLGSYRRSPAGPGRPGTGGRPSVREPRAAAAGVAARPSVTPWQTTATATAAASRSDRENGAGSSTM